MRARLEALTREAGDDPKAAARAWETLESRFTVTSANFSQLLIVLHVPFLALR